LDEILGFFRGERTHEITTNHSIENPRKRGISNERPNSVIVRHSVRGFGKNREHHTDNVLITQMESVEETKGEEDTEDTINARYNSFRGSSMIKKPQGAEMLLGGGDIGINARYNFETEDFEEHKSPNMLKRLSGIFKSPMARNRMSVKNFESMIPGKDEAAFIEGEEVVIHLKEHVHTKFCDRKERVCTAMGRVREREILHVEGVREPPIGCVWVRSETNDPSSEYTHIPGSEMKSEYALTLEDVDRHVGFLCRWIDNEDEEVGICLFA